jgi:hypothetical protein
MSLDSWQQLPLCSGHNFEMIREVDEEDDLYPCHKLTILAQTKAFYCITLPDWIWLGPKLVNPLHSLDYCKKYIN